MEPKKTTERKALSKVGHTLYALGSVFSAGWLLPVWGLYWATRRWGARSTFKAAGGVTACGLVLVLSIGMVNAWHVSNMTPEERKVYEEELATYQAEQRAKDLVEAEEEVAENERNDERERTLSLKRKADTDAIGVVAKSIASNKLGVTVSDLQSKANSRGQGTLVYVAKTRFSGTQRYVIWMVIGGQAFPFNSPSKMVTPSLPWPREAPEQLWERTNFGPYGGASDAIELVFGS